LLICRAILPKQEKPAEEKPRRRVKKTPREPRLRHHLKLIPKSDLHPKTLRVTRKKPRRGKVLEKDPVPIEHWCLFGWERPVEIKKEIP